MAHDLRHLESELATLSVAERLNLAAWLIDSVLSETEREPPGPARPLSSLAGRFSGGPGDTAERAEEILEAEMGATAFGAQP